MDNLLVILADNFFTNVVFGHGTISDNLLLVCFTKRVKNSGGLVLSKAMWKSLHE